MLAPNMLDPNMLDPLSARLSLADGDSSLGRHKFSLFIAAERGALVRRIRGMTSVAQFADRRRPALYRPGAILAAHGYCFGEYAEK
jgi:hypothetical protein